MGAGARCSRVIDNGDLHVRVIEYYNIIILLMTDERHTHNNLIGVRVLAAFHAFVADFTAVFLTLLLLLLVVIFVQRPGAYTRPLSGSNVSTFHGIGGALRGCFGGV